MMEIKSLKSMRKQLTKEQNDVSKHIEAQSLWQNQSLLEKMEIKRQLEKLLKNIIFFSSFSEERKISAISAPNPWYRDRDRRINRSNARTKSCNNHQQGSRARLGPIDSSLPVSFRIQINCQNTNKTFKWTQRAAI